EKVQLAEAALTRAPDLAVLHLMYGKNLARSSRLPEAGTAYRKGLACGDEPDTKTRLLLELALVTETPAEKIRLLEEARGLNGNLPPPPTAAVILRGG